MKNGLFTMQCIGLVFHAALVASYVPFALPIRSPRAPTTMSLSAASSAEAAPLAVLAGVSKQYRVNAFQRMFLPPGSRPDAAFVDVSLTIRPGTIYTSVGASGSGKTTLLQLLAGELAPSSGRVDTLRCRPLLLGDEAFKQLGAELQAAGSLRAALARADDARSLPRGLSGSSTDDDAARDNEDNDGDSTVDPSSRSRSSVGSGGVWEPVTREALLALVPAAERNLPWARLALPQRVAATVVLGLAQATEDAESSLASGHTRAQPGAPPPMPPLLLPPLLLLDEVLDGLAGPSAWATPACKAAADAVLRAAATRFGCSAVLATHDLHRTAALADRVLFFQAGELKQDAPPHEATYFLAYKTATTRRC